jgi:hypothetical protein
VCWIFGGWCGFGGAHGGCVVGGLCYCGCRVFVGIFCCAVGFGCDMAMASKE